MQTDATIMNPRTTLPAKTTAGYSAVRISNPCDSCVVRRVKCGVERPCHECRKRGLECTSLRARKKRGPKGPRPSTSERARARLHQQRLAAALAVNGQSEAALSPSVTTTSPDNDDDEAAAGDRDQGADDKHQSHQDASVRSSSSFRSPPPPNCGMTCRSPEKHRRRRIPLSAYYHFIDIFNTRLYPVWPVVSPDRLMANMAFNEDDHGTFALAAALCAATISQLRLPEHHTADSPAHDTSTISSHAFAREAERFRSAYDYREDCGLPSLLTAFFLHMYYSNANKLRTAALLLREAITCCHTLELHRSDTMTTLGSTEQSLRLRVYWLLFISEMTFAAQNRLPTIMQPIEAMPHYEHHHKGADLRAFMSLTRLFSFLSTPARAIAGCGGGQGDMATAGTELAAVQAKLASDGDDAALNETQRVDLCVTRQWIRILTWEYMTRRFPMSCHADDPAFSLLLPVQIGREVLSFMATVDSSFIVSHGYGMELKIFRMADAILDIMMCVPSSASPNGRMAAGAGDVLSSLQKIVFMVGGEQSEFFGKLQLRLGTFTAASGADPCRMLSAAEVVEGWEAEERGVVDDLEEEAELAWDSGYDSSRALSVATLDTSPDKEPGMGHCWEPPKQPNGPWH